MAQPDTETAPATLDAAVRRATRLLHDNGLDTPALDARLLIGHILGLAHDRLVAVPEQALPAQDWIAISAALARRLDHEPVSRILGYREFWGRRFQLSEATLDPRPETELLVETALDILAGSSIEHPRLIEVGTGTGCVLLTLLAELPQATGTATDISAEALAVARRNAELIGVADRATFVEADGLEDIVGTFDMILSNPPYIRTAEIPTLAPEVRRYDPAAALDGGPDGLALYRRIVCEAQRVAPGGWIVLEVGHGQAGAVLDLASRSGSVADQTSTTHMDLAGLERCVAMKAQH